MAMIYRLAKVVVLSILLALIPSVAYAQSDYGVRIPGKVSGWFAPVGSNLIGSDEKDHINRGSVNAWDWSTSLGSPVFSIGPGVVSYAGCNDQGHYGCWLLIDHGSGYTSSSAHCLEGSIRVQSGQQVDASTQICNIGRTGWTSWPHVHLVIKKDGVHQPISNFFDIRLVRYCHFTKCQATNDPQAPVTFGNSTWVGQAITTARTTVDLRLAQMVFAVLFLLYFVLGRVGKAIVFVVVAFVLAVVVALPPQQTLAASPMVSSGLAGWEQVYPIVQSNEGWKCTHDPIRTAGGITQGTYDAWRMSKGVGPADVCTNLTRDQAKTIYYERYWLASGADKLPIGLALTHVDHAINAGVGAARAILAQCGNNVACYNAARVASYQSMRNCSLYCTSWINRVNKIRKFSGG